MSSVATTLLPSLDGQHNARLLEFGHITTADGQLLPFVNYLAPTAGHKNLTAVIDHEWTIFKVCEVPSDGVK